MGWFGEASSPGWSWWWVLPLIGMAVCIAMCMFSRSPAGGRRWGCCGHWDRRGWQGDTPDNDLRALQNEVRELRDELQKIKTTRGGEAWTNGPKN